MLRNDGSLRAGLHLLPGKPKAIAIRALGADVSVSEKYTQAFHLPAVVGLREPASMVVPVGWFKEGRTVELFSDGKQTSAQMCEVLELGEDFERISYTIP
jgi:hypothetical protein